MKLYDATNDPDVLEEINSSDETIICGYCGEAFGDRIMVNDEEGHCFYIHRECLLEYVDNLKKSILKLRETIK